MSAKLKTNFTVDIKKYVSTFRLLFKGFTLLLKGFTDVHVV